MKKELIFPFLLKCCDLAQEQFWKNVFEDLAYGKAPYGAFISKGFLSCTYKGRAFSYKLVEKETEILYREIYKLLAEKLGILSTSEQNQKRLLFEELEKNIRENSEEWGKIRKKNIKDLILEKYVVNMKQKYNLSIIQARKLMAVIYLATQFKKLTSKDIEYSNGEIISINGITFREGKIVLNKNITSLI
jgi:hypothetical protein